MTHLTTWPREPFTLGDLSILDIGEGRLRHAVRSGRVRCLVRGVFVAAEVPDSIELRARAVSRIVPSHHVVTDRTAAWLHEVDALVWADVHGRPPIEICALRGHQATHLTGTDGRTRDLATVDVMRLHGVTVTTPLRTGLDLGCCLHRSEAYAALNALAARHGLKAEDYLKQLPRFRGRRGVRQLRVLLPLVEPRVESARESWLLLAIADATLPLPEPQHWIDIDGVPTYRLDFAYPWLRVCIEYDGMEWHERTPEQKERDRERRRWLRENGWTIIVVRNGDFSGPRLDAWTRDLSEALLPRYTNRRW